jgi:hypothetical protein
MVCLCKNARREVRQTSPLSIARHAVVGVWHLAQLLGRAAVAVIEAGAGAVAGDAPALALIGHAIPVAIAGAVAEGGV